MFELDPTTLRVLVVVFVATLIRSAVGFGEALIAVPLLSFFLPLSVAAPLAVLISITIAATIVIQDWRQIHLQSAVWLVLSSVFGIPLGLLLLTSGHQHAVKAALGAFLLVFSLFCCSPESCGGSKRTVAGGCSSPASWRACLAERME